jgi:SAM-dependent methyltransferase
MRRDVVDLRAFYATPLGQAVRDMVTRQLVNAWGDARGLDILGLGYATPFLWPFHQHARRVTAAMPAAQGVEIWPPGEANLACLADETALPFPAALFDRVLVVHGLEESPAPGALLAEVERVMAPGGRAIIAVVSRGSLWAGAESTPFGHGRPFTRTQLERALHEAGLAPVAWSRALYVPPWAPLAPHAELVEQLASRLAAPLSGLILLEAIKQTFAVRPRPAEAAVVAPFLRPAPALPCNPIQRLGKRDNLRHS